jgi:hypothetical protein
VNTNQQIVQTWEDQADKADKVRQMIACEGWNIVTSYLKDIYERKILDTFRRIPGDAKYDAGFRILQGEYQMLQHVMHVPREIIDLGEQARRHIADLKNLHE